MVNVARCGNRPLGILRDGRHHTSRPLKNASATTPNSQPPTSKNTLNGRPGLVGGWELTCLSLLSVYSHAFNRQDWQQGELEIVQPLTFPERNLERIVGFGDLRHGLEGRPVHLLEQRSTEPHMRCDHPQDVAAP